MKTQPKRPRGPRTSGPARVALAGGRSAQAAIRREQLLSTALDLFCAHGYAATSTKRIAEAAGVTEGLVFHYFGSKEALLLEVASRQNTFAGRVLALAQSAAGGSARDLLVAIAQGFAEVSEREAAFVGFLNAEAQVNPVLRAPLLAGTKVVLGGLVERLEARVAAGELRADASLAAAMYGFFGGFAFFFGQHRDLGATAWRREAEAFSHAWADQCWRGIASSQWLSKHTTSERERSPR